jgi:hypothetical protein
MNVKNLLILILLLNSKYVFAMSNADFFKLNSAGASERSRLGSTFYMNGVTMGFMVANISGNNPLICFPKNMSIGDYNYENLVKDEMQIDKSIDGEFPVAITLFNAFKRKFPCK